MEDKAHHEEQTKSHAVIGQDDPAVVCQTTVPGCGDHDIRWLYASAFADQHLRMR